MDNEENKNDHQSYSKFFFCSAEAKEKFQEMDEKTLKWVAGRLAHQINMMQIEIMEKMFKEIDTEIVEDV